MILIVSPDSVDSDYVRAEVEWALNNQRKVIPVITRTAQLPLRWHSLQYCDASTEQTIIQTLVQLVEMLPRRLGEIEIRIWGNEKVSRYIHPVCNLFLCGNAGASVHGRSPEGRRFGWHYIDGDVIAHHDHERKRDRGCEGDIQWTTMADGHHHPA